MNEIEAPRHRRRLAWRSPWRAAPARAAPRRPRAAAPTKRAQGGGRRHRAARRSAEAGAEQIIPKEKKRDISADAARRLREGDEAVPGRAEGRRPVAVASARGVSDAFKRVADDNPGLVEARFNQGAVLYECGREDEAARIWEGLKYGPAITNLGYIAWKNNETGRAESLFKRAIDDDPLHSVEARNNLAQILRDKARKAVEHRREEELRRPGGQQPAHRARARQQQPAGVLHAGVHLLRHEHAGDGQAGRQPGHQEGRRNRDRQVRGREGRGGRRRQGRQGRQGQGARRRRARRRATTRRPPSRKEIGVARPAPASPAT